MTEQFANNASSTLNGSIDNSTTAVVVTNGTPFSATGNFRIIIDSEIMLVTNHSGNSMTVVRGQEGTTAASHNSGTTVTQIITSAALFQFRSDGSLIDTYVNRPAAGFSGRTFQATDGPNFIDDGTSWRPIVNNVLCTEPPQVISLTWVNQGTTTAINTAGRILTTFATESGAVFHGLSKTGAGNSAEAAAASFGNANSAATFDYNEWGVYLRESSTGKIATMTNYVQLDGNVYNASLNVARWTNNTTRAAVTGNLGAGWSMGVTGFLRIRVNGANITFEQSHDGQNWLEAAGSPIAKTTCFTTAPDESGICFFGGFSNALGIAERVIFKHVKLT